MENRYEEVTEFIRTQMVLPKEETKLIEITVDDCMKLKEEYQEFWRNHQRFFKSPYKHGACNKFDTTTREYFEELVKDQKETNTMFWVIRRVLDDKMYDRLVIQKTTKKTIEKEEEHV